MTALAALPLGNGYPALRFEPAPVLPSQLVAGARPGTPAQRLMLAVLSSALADYRQYLHASSGGGRRYFREAAAWLSSPRCDDPFAFVSVCDALGLDPSYIRDRLRRWVSLQPPSATDRVSPRRRNIFFDRGVAPGSRIGAARLPRHS